MARWEPLPIAIGAYTDDVLPQSSQDVVNYLLEKAERPGTRSPFKVRQCPGASTFSNLGDAPIRGMHNAEGLLLVVCGTDLITISGQGNATIRGTIPGVKRLTMAHNQITGGNEVFIANYSSGYIYNTKTATLSQITDDGFSGAKAVDFVDGFFVFADAAGRFWGWSDLANGTSYNTLDRSDAEAQPDRITTLKVIGHDVAVFGERTTEFFRNTGAGTGTFQRIDGTDLTIGCPSTHGVCVLDGALFMVGSDGSAYEIRGYTATRISTHPIEQAWSRCNLSACYSYIFEDQGHKIWYVTMTDGQTFGFDCSTREWHRRKSEGIEFWRMSHLEKWNGGWIAGDFANGKAYFLDWNLNTEGDEVMERRGRFHVIHDDGNRVQVHGLKLEFDTGKDSESFPRPFVWLSDLRLTGDLSDGPIAEVVSYQYTATGGQFPLTFSILSGSLPAGLSMSTAGVVTGTRTTTGTYNWTVRVTDSAGNTADLADTSITTPYTITGDVPNGTAGVATSGAYSHDGGLAPVTYAVTSGSFPAGLTLASNGMWSGTPTAGTYGPWTITATDSVGNTATLVDSATFSALVTFSTVRVVPSDASSLDNGNRDVHMSTGTNASSALNVIKSTGNWYVEFEVISPNLTGYAGSTSLIVWTQSDSSTPSYNDYTGGTDVLECRANGVYSNAGSMTLTGGPVFSNTGMKIGVAFKAATREIWVKDYTGNWAGGGDPALGTSPLATLAAGTGSITVAICFNKISGSFPKIRMNAGQEAFMYAIPSGFSVLSA